MPPCWARDSCRWRSALIRACVSSVLGIIPRALAFAPTRGRELPRRLTVVSWEFAISFADEEVNHDGRNHGSHDQADSHRHFPSDAHADGPDGPRLLQGSDAPVLVRHPAFEFFNTDLGIVHGLLHAGDLALLFNRHVAQS